MKYCVQYALPYYHRVMVGIEAETPEAAAAKAEKLFDDGDIWQDTAEIPLLYDDYEEDEDAGESLLFTVEQTLDADKPWPEADASVKELHRREAAFRAARLLIEAYLQCEECGVDRCGVNQAYKAALQAVE